MIAEGTLAGRRSRAWWRGRLLRLLGAVCLPLLGIALGAVTVWADTTAPNFDDEIVYLDPGGFIRVLDPNPPAGTLSVTWASPSGGWVDFTLTDVTGDGDAEIAAVRATPGGGELVIFDPVARDSAPELVQFFNGVPWAQLYARDLPRPPKRVGSGNFDLERSGQELIIVYGLNDRLTRDRFVVLRQSVEGGDGRAWEDWRAWELDGNWSVLATGNLADGADVIAIVDRGDGQVAVWRVAPTPTRLFRNENRSLAWSSAAFGQFNEGGPQELAAVRDGSIFLPSSYVFRFQDGTFVDDFAEVHAPGFEHVFFANIGGNGDEELVMLRSVPPELGPRPRLIIRDRGNDAIALREAQLDGDNAYRGGAAGDLDADGRDEIVLVRNNRIRVYFAPEQSTTPTLYVLNTDGRTVRTGNVDAQGLGVRQRLTANVAGLDETLVVGQVGEERTLTVVDGALSQPLNVTVALVNAPWATVTPTSGGTPLTLQVTFDAQGRTPGVYRGALVVDAAQAEVDNDPLTLPLTLTVDAGIATDPAAVVVDYGACDPPLTARSVTVALSGPTGTPYSLELAGNPTWVTVAPEGGQLPESVTLTVDPALRTGPVSVATLRMTGELAGTDGVTIATPVVLLCGAERRWLPIVR